MNTSNPMSNHLSTSVLMTTSVSVTSPISVYTSMVCRCPIQRDRVACTPRHHCLRNLGTHCTRPCCGAGCLELACLRPADELDPWAASLEWAHVEALLVEARVADLQHAPDVVHVGQQSGGLQVGHPEIRLVECPPKHPGHGQKRPQLWPAPHRSRRRCRR